MSVLTFQCKLTKSYITFKCDSGTKTAAIEDNFIDPNLPRPYFIVLRNAIDRLIADGYKKIVQTVTKHEWDNFLVDSGWKIKNETIYPGAILCYIIECDISIALNCIAKGFGFS